MNLCRQRFLLLGVVAFVVLIVSACGSGSGSSGEADGKSALRFGLITDITKFSDYGLRTRDGVQMAVDEVNAEGGINGHRVEVVFGDDAGDPQQAATLTRKMTVDDKVLAIWGPFTSGSAEVAFPVANQLQVPIIASTSAKPGLASQNRPWAFRNSLTEEKLLEPAVEQFAKDNNVRRVAVAYDVKEPIAKAVGSEILPNLAERNGLDVVNASNPITWQTGEQNFSAQVTNLKSLNVDGLLLGATAGDAARLAKEMERQDLDIPVVGGGAIFTQSLLDQGGQAVEGWYTAGVFWKDNPDPKVQKFVRDIRKYHKKEFPRDPDPIWDSATWYDTAKITMKIAEEKNITPQTPLDEARTEIRDGWANLKDYPGISGMTSIDKEGEAVKEVYVMKVKDGKFVRVT
jgi:branched-chain amino acid transport system substrate-binding protein